MNDGQRYQLILFVTLAMHILSHVYGMRENQL